MKIELTDEEAECIGTALLNLVRMYERQTILDENEYQEYKKAHHVLIVLFVEHLKSECKRRFGDTLQLF